MALTLAEAAKLSNDILLQGVIETIIKDSPVLQRMPFIEIAGNGLTYNREATAPSAAFFDVGDTWTESTPTFTQQTVTLKIMGGDADIVNKLARTSGSFLEADRDEFGQMLQFYDGIPIGVSDYISDAQTQGTSTDCSTVYAFQTGEGALAGLTGPGPLQGGGVGG